MTFNIRYGTATDGDDHWSRRRELVADTVRRHAPHVLGVQEALAFQVDWLADRFPGHRRVGVGRNADGGGELSALFVDSQRLEIVDSGTFWLSPTPDEPGSKGWDAALPRICTWAELRESAGDTRLRVWNTHFDHRGREARRRSAASIAARVVESELPDVVMGDLNAGEDSPPLEALRAAGLRDTFRVVHPDAGRAGTFHGFRGVRTGAKIDHVLVDERFEVLAAGIDTTAYDRHFASDHFAVTATVALRP